MHGFVTSSRTSPARSRCPRSNFPSAIPRVVMFSRGASRRDAEFLERLLIHHQNLTRAPAPSVKAILESLIFNGEHFLEFAHGLAVRQALK